MIWKYLYSESSSGDCGTLYQLRNRLSRTNVVTKPTAAFNACDDFFVTVITDHVVAAALEVVKDMPGLDMEWMNTAEERETCLEEVCGRIINKFVDFTFHKLPTECEDQVFVMLWK